jgi:LPXTG-site transpeptidase (sortase) family protein
VRKKFLEKLVFRSVIAVQVLVIVFLVTFLLLNSPAYVKKARFAASGRDLSADLVGSFIPREAIDSIATSAVTHESPQFPVIEISIADIPALGPSAPLPVVSQGQTNPATTTPTAPAKPAITPINPNVFVPNTITIPRIGVRAPIVEIPVNTEKEQQKGLERGVIHIMGTPGPGEEGNAFYAGHSSDFFAKKGKYKTVFTLLPELHKGDYFIISDQSRAYYYTINETVITGPKDTTVMMRGKPGEKFASVQTSYPINTAKKRFVVVGKLDRIVDASSL